MLNAFEGVALDAKAQAEIYRTLEACAERRRALEETPEHDPERWFIGEAETNGYLGQLESGYEYDDVEYKPDGEHYWEGLGEGGNAAEIDRVVGEMKERLAKETPEERAEREAEAEAAVQAQIARQSLPYKPDPDPDDPRLDWRNWDDDGYNGPPSDPPLLLQGRGTAEAAVEGPTSTAPKPRKPYRRKRTPKRRFVALDEAQYASHKAKAIKQVEVERREAAAAEAERRARSIEPESLS